MSTDGIDSEVEDLDPIEGTELADELSEQPERLSVRESLNKAWKEHGGELPESRRSKDDEIQTRDATGKGAPDGRTAGKTGGAEQIPAAEARQGTESTPSTAASEPPKGWAKEAQAEWGKLPPAVQAAVTKREADMTAGAKQLQDRYGTIHQAVTRAAPLFQKYGRTPDQGMDNVLKWFEAIERNPAQFIPELAKSYNLDVSKLGAATQPAAGATPDQTTQLPADPRIDQLMQKIGSFETAEQERQRQAIEDGMRRWAASKPHFEAVRQMMSQVVAGAGQMHDTSILDAAGRPDLDKVYDRAIYMVPEVRAAIEQEKAAAAKAARDKQLADARAARDKQAAGARRAGASVRSGAPGDGSRVNGAAVPPKKGLSVRESINAAMAEVRGS